VGVVSLRQPQLRIEFRYLATEDFNGHTNRDGSHGRYPAQFRCKERGRALEGRGTLQGVAGAGFTAAVRTSSGEPVVKRTFDPNAEETLFFPRLVGG
jgi:hypothetical protein